MLAVRLDFSRLPIIRRAFEALVHVRNDADSGYPLRPETRQKVEAVLSDAKLEEVNV